MQQAITYAHVDPNSCHHMATLGHMLIALIVLVCCVKVEPILFAYKKNVLQYEKS